MVLVGSPQEPETDYKSPYFAKSYLFPWNPDPLCQGNNYSIYDEMRTDDQVKTALTIKKNFVINTGWEIHCDDENVKSFLEDTFRRLNTDQPMNPTFEGSLFEFLSAFDYGFSMTEPIYTLAKEGEWAGKYIYKSLKTRPPHTFRFDLDDPGNITNVVQTTAKRGDIKMSPEIFLHNVYQQEFGNPYGLSDLSAAHEFWKAKKFVKRFWLIYLEKFGSPTVIGRYDVGMSDDEIAKMKSLIESIQNNTTMILPKSAPIDIIQPLKDSSDIYERAINFLNTAIARAILVPDLLGFSGEKTGGSSGSGGSGGGGSHALGVQQFEVFMGIIQHERSALEHRITDRLVTPLVALNFGEDYDAEFKFKPYKQADIIEAAKLWVTAVSGKLWVPSDEEVNHLRDLAGFPEGDVERPVDPVQTIDPKTGLPLPGQKPGQDGGQKPGAPVDPAADKNPDKNPNKHAQEADVAKIGDPTIYQPAFASAGRKLTVYEGKMDFSQVQAMLDRQESTALKRLKSAGADIIRDFVEQVRTKGLLRNAAPEKLKTIKPHFQKPMNAIINSHLEGTFREAYDDARLEIVPASKAIKFAASMLPKDFVDLVNAESFKITGDYYTEISKKAQNILIEGLKNGASEGELMKLVRDAMTESSDKWLQSVIRTKTTDIYNNARRSYWETDDIAKQIVAAYQFSAIMDDRTSEICASLDQSVYDVTDDVGRVTPPLHFNCRSILVPITKFEDFTSEDVPSIQTIQDRGGNLKSFMQGER